MNTTSPSDTLERYLRQVRSGLRSLPETEVTDILAELRSHIMECTAGGAHGSVATVDAVLEALGRADEVASQYLTENSLAAAASSRSPWLVLRSLFQWATASAAGFVVLILSLTGYLLGLPMIVMALIKPFAPGHVGLWVDMHSPHHSVFFGIPYDPQPGQEMLGWWLVPVCLVLGIAVLVATLQFDLWCLRHYQRYLARRRFG